MTIGKEINEYQNDHTLKAKTCIDNSQKKSVRVPQQRAMMRYNEMELVHNNEHKYVTHVTKQSKRSSLMVGPTKPDLFLH